MKMFYNRAKQLAVKLDLIQKKILTLWAQIGNDGLMASGWECINGWRFFDF